MICQPGDIVSTPSGEVTVVETLSSDFAYAPIGVFWLTNDCGRTAALDFFGIAANIRKALRDCNHRGRLNIKAFGYDPTLVLRFAGGDVELRDGSVFCPFHLEDSSTEPMMKKLFVDILAWTLRNPPPGHILFIAKDMSLHIYGLLYKMKLGGYNILLGKLPKPDPRISDREFSLIASTIWHWKLLHLGQLPVTVSLPILPGSNEAHLEGDVSLIERTGLKLQ